MKNTLNDLNNYLFEAIERINDDSLSSEQMDNEIRRAETVTKIADKIIDNAELQLKAIQHMDDYAYKGERHMPALLIGKSETGGQ